MVIPHPRLEPRRGSGRFDASDQSLGNHDRKGVVDALMRDGANGGSHLRQNILGGAVRIAIHHSKHRQPMRRELHAMPSDEFSKTVVHTATVPRRLE